MLLTGWKFALSNQKVYHTQIWVVTRHQYRISALVSQTSFRGETSGGVAKCRQFTQVSLYFSVSITFPFPSKQDNFTNASLDYNLLYLIDFRFLCHDLHKKRLNECVSSSQLECLVIWRQTFDIEISIVQTCSAAS